MFDLRNFNAAIGTVLLACVPGCGPDNMARLMQRVFQANRYFEPPLLVQNKAGGGGTMARIYLNRSDHDLSDCDPAKTWSDPGSSAMHIENDGKESRASARHLAVHANAGDQWRLVARQSTRQPEA